MNDQNLTYSTQQIVPDNILQW